MWSRIAKRTTTTDGCTKSNSFLGDKTKNKKEGNKKKKDFICYSKQSIYICPR